MTHLSQMSAAAVGKAQMQLTAHGLPVREALSARHVLETSHCDQTPMILLYGILDENVKGNNPFI